MAFLDFSDFEIISGSPERFIQVRNNKVNTRPIKGTIGRHKDPVVDQKNAQDLRESIKDQSENLMIVSHLCTTWTNFIMKNFMKNHLNE